MTGTETVNDADAKQFDPVADTETFSVARFTLHIQNAKQFDPVADTETDDGVKHDDHTGGPNNSIRLRILKLCVYYAVWRVW